MWFETLTGFDERAVADVAEQFECTGDTIRSKVNGRVMRFGRFETPTLATLRERLGKLDRLSGHLGVREVVGDVRSLHIDSVNAGALFQVASQFNTLEMIGPNVTPEDGIDRYERDRTQGPACAIACGAGTIYRNYLVPVAGATGQSASRQLDLLADLAAALGVDIPMKNGYAFPTREQLKSVAERIDGLDEPGRQALLATLRVGLQWDTEVTFRDAGHTVTQAYCSALPIAYGGSGNWEPFARLVLEGAYEATLAAGALNAATTGNRTVFLTLLGGGAFGNRKTWIIDALERALARVDDVNLDVAIVSYGGVDSALQRLL